MTENVFLKKEIKRTNETVQLAKYLGNKSIDLAFRKRKSISENSNSKFAHSSTKYTQYDTAEGEPIRVRSTLGSIDRVSHPVQKQSDNHGRKRRSHISDNIQQLASRTVMTNYKTKEKEQSSQRVVTQPISQLPNRTQPNKPPTPANKQNLKIYDKHLQIWINSIIQEHCVEQKFDKKISLSALKKYGVDKNTLVAQGLNSNSINRIYNSLYIYSQGFSNMIREIGKINSKMYRALWRIYSILLQYFSEGEFKALIAQLQRDKSKEIEQIASKLEAHQQIINQQEQKNKQQHSQIIKELNGLKEVNFNLVIDNSVLNEDRNNADLAFRDQVALRMMFESKISDVYGLYREMSNKHTLLFDDFNLKLQEWKAMKEKVSQLSGNNLSLNKENALLKQDIKQLKQASNVIKKQRDDLQQTCKEKRDSQLQLMIKQQELSKTIRQIELTLNEQKNRLGNAELVIELHAENQAELKREYSEILSENKQLEMIITQQQGKLSQFVEQKKIDIDRERIELQTQLRHLKERLDTRQQCCNSMETQIEMLNLKIQEKQHQNEQLQFKNQSLTSNLAVNNEKIEDMKRANIELQEDLTQLLQNQQQMQKKSAAAQLQKQKYENQIHIHTAKISELTDTIDKLQSNISMLTLKLQYEEQFKQTQLAKIEQKYRIVQINAKLAKQQSQKSVEERNKIRVAYDELWNKYKNEQFQRQDLDLRYKHSLSVLQSLKDKAKEFERTISSMKEQLDQETRRIKILESNLSNKQKRYASEAHRYNAKIQEQKQQITRKGSYVHPMTYQDTLAAFCRSESRNLQLQDALKEQRKTFHDNFYQMEANVKQARAQLSTIRQSASKQVNKKELQNEYYKKKNIELQAAINNLELSIQIEKNTEKAEKTYTLSHELQMRYLEVIRQKTNKINELIASMQAVHDQNNQLLVRVQSTEEQLKKQQQKVEEIAGANSSAHDKTAQFLQKSAFSWMSKEQQERISLKLKESAISVEDMALMIQESILRGSVRKSHPRQASPHKRDIRQSQFWITDQFQTSERDSGIKKQVKIKKNGFQQADWRKDLASKIKNANNFYRK